MTNHIFKEVFQSIIKRMLLSFMYTLYLHIYVSVGKERKVEKLQTINLMNLDRKIMRV